MWGKNVKHAYTVVNELDKIVVGIKIVLLNLSLLVQKTEEKLLLGI